MKYLGFLIGCIVFGAFIVDQLPMGGLLVWALGTPVHELGHTMFAWFSGHYAAPTFFFTAMPSEDRWAIVWLTLFGVGGWLVYLAIQKELYFLMGAGLLIIGTTLFGTFKIANTKANEYMVWGGLGGEIILPLVFLAVLVFLIEQFEIDKLQIYTALFWIGIIFGHSSYRWIRAVDDPTQVPFGAFGEGEETEETSHGDVDRLLRDYNWTLDQLIHSYQKTGLYCLIGMIPFGYLLSKHQEVEEINLEQTLNKK